MKLLNKIKQLFSDDYTNMGIIDAVFHEDSRVQYNCNIVLLSLCSIEKLKKELFMLEHLLSLYPTNSIQYKNTKKQIKQKCAEIRDHEKIVSEYRTKLSPEQYDLVLECV